MARAISIRKDKSLVAGAVIIGLLLWNLSSLLHLLVGPSDVVLTVERKASLVSSVGEVSVVRPSVDISAIQGRPLFIAAHPAAQGTTAEPTTQKILAAEQSLMPRFHGIVRRNGVDMVVCRENGEAKVSLCAQGDVIGGWRVSEIRKTHVVAVMGNDEVVFSFVVSNTGQSLETGSISNGDRLNELIIGPGAL